MNFSIARQIWPMPASSYIEQFCGTFWYSRFRQKLSGILQNNSDRLFDFDGILCVLTSWFQSICLFHDGDKMFQKLRIRAGTPLEITETQSFIDLLAGCTAVTFSHTHEAVTVTVV